MTSKIHRKISKFGTQAPIVEKALTSFQHFYQAANKLDDNLIQKHGSQVAAQVKTLLHFSSLSFSVFFRQMLPQIQLNLFYQVLLMLIYLVRMLFNYLQRILSKKSV
jgi:hypothetical protein